MTSRRNFLKNAAACAPASVLAQASSSGQGMPPPSYSIADLPQHYDVDRSVINLENAYWGVMPRETAAAYAENIQYVNRLNSVFARNTLADHTMNAQFDDARASIASLLHCDTEEIALTRSGSDGLQSLIVNYNLLKPGDAVIYCDLDYDAMIFAMEYLQERRGAQIVRFTMPEPATTANILAAYEDVLKRTPNAKLLLVTHVSNRTGLVTPVREIVAMARARGVDTIVDAAHGIGCLDVTLPDFGADFVGWSMHKWLAAPLGTGAVYIRKSRIPDIEIAFDNHDVPTDDIRARIPAGTVNFAAFMTIPAAIDFHRKVGPAAKERQLRTLRNRWVDAARSIPGVGITVPDDPARYCAITSFRLRGMHTDAEAERVQHVLLQKHNVHTVARKGVHQGPVIRVTPALFNTLADCDALVRALEAEQNLFA
ncbi:aminotransferase class V-fold PLP-dependent enzyme [Terriglobus aquaticus]|uniref:Aminotransferase class V-fold PLP-dependent enzyme n=1 Tax=Terriglobus aquaticus TaxID=940139 RepID=A0ABW9KGY3_9BACT|nr:aminotransferase class V-fold PLP-dependent enzyme [Terriglobus aquaticus]